MSFEKIAPPNTRTEAGEKLEHPAYKAARVIRQLHTDNIELINSGYVFMKDGVDVSDSMKASCEQQIKLCNEIMRRAEHMDPSHWSPSLLLCEEVQSLVGKEFAKRNAEGGINDPDKAGQEQEVLGSILPEIGNYGHGK